MNLPSVQQPGPSRKPRAGKQAGTRVVVLVFVIFLLGMGLGWYFSMRTKRAPENFPNQTTALSDATRAVLMRLDAPVELKFYVLVDSAAGADSLKAFAGRVEQLLDAYQQEARGKLKVTRLEPRSDADANAARADGVRAFNIDKGEACYLGLALIQQGRKEALPQLAPEWEPALESDLTRALSRLIDAAAGVARAGEAQSDPAVVEEVKRLVPKYSSVSMEEGTRIIRQAAIKDFQTAAKEMETQLTQAQQRLSQAQGGSEAEQQAASKQLQQVQFEQTEKLKQIAAKSQAQIEALQRLKETAH